MTGEAVAEKMPDGSSPGEPLSEKLAASPEQAADLAALALSIADSPVLPTAGGEQAAVPAAPALASFENDAAMCVDMFADMATAYCPEVAPLWPTDKRKLVTVALAGVFKKYNFSFERFGPEFALLVAAGPVLWQTSKVIAAQMNAQAAAPGAEPEKKSDGNG